MTTSQNSAERGRTLLPLEALTLPMQRRDRRGGFANALCWALAGAVLLALALGVARNDAVGLPVIRDYIFAPLILQGVVVTILLTFGSAVMGLVGGLAIAGLRMSELTPLRLLAIGYVNLFRAVPLLVQILIWYNLGSFFPGFGLDLPQLGIAFEVSINDILSPMAACLIAFGLNQSAYMGEIIRGGLLSVPPGQIEAGVALGMTRRKVFWRVKVPLAARAVIPALGNDIISLLKGTALVSVIGVGDLMTRTQGIYATTYQIIPMLLVASLWYLALTAALALVQGGLERRFAVGTSADAPGAKESTPA